MSLNSSNVFDRPLYLELRASRPLAAVLWTLAAAALGACVSLPWDVGLRALCMMICFAYFLYLHRVYVLMRGPTAIRKLSWDRRRGWRVLPARGAWVGVSVCAPTLVTAKLVGARFVTDRRRRFKLLVVADRLPANDFRRLRVRLIQSAHGRGDRTEISYR